MKQHIPKDNEIQAQATAVMNQAVTFRQLQQLQQAQVIDEQGLNFAEKNYLPPLQWGRWLMRLCLGLGTVLLLLGVIFFFAYNWASMPVWSKLVLIQASMLICFIAAIGIGLQRLLGQCLLLSGTVFIGVFFAVFGQIYQTGADAWQLFALWSVLMLGFVLLSRFPPQWLLQWSITGLALVLYLQQNGWGLTESMMFVVIVAYSLAVWYLQVRLSRNHRWLDCAWLRYLAALAAHINLAGLFMLSLFDHDFIWVVLALVIVVVVLQWHRFRHRDLLIQVFSIATLAIMLWSFVLYLLVEVSRSNDIVFMISVMLLTTIGLSVAVYQVVLRLKHQYEVAKVEIGGLNDVK